MKVTYVLATVLYVSVVSATVSAAVNADATTPTTATVWTTPTVPPSPPEWDQLLFTQIWPAGFCKTITADNDNDTCVLPDAQRAWTIHGLWPTQSGTDGPNDCATTPFNVSELASIEDKLKVNWPWLSKNMTNEDFWKHEWEKHGTCMCGDVSGILPYFTEALEKADDYNMQLIMKDAGYIPSTTPYNQSEMITALTNVLGKKPSLICEETKDESILSQVIICFSKYGTNNMTDCNPSATCNNTEILYGPHPGENSANLLSHSVFYLLASLFVLLRN